MERNFKGVWIPKHVWLDDRLTLAEKCLLVEIDYLDDGENGCKVNNNYLANFAQLSLRSVVTAIAKLNELGYIIIRNGGNKERTLHSNMNSIQSTAQNITNNYANIAQLGEQQRKICAQRNKVSKKVNKKIILLETPAHTHEGERLESYEDILNGLEVHGIYRLSVFDFIKHLQANGCKVINSRLESLVMALDRAYRTNDVAKCVEIKTAIANGYKRLPCEGYN